MQTRKGVGADDRMGLKAAALAVGIPYPTLYLWAVSGRIPAEKIAGRYVVTRRDAEVAGATRRERRGGNAA